MVERIASNCLGNTLADDEAEGDTVIGRRFESYLHNILYKEVCNA